MQSYWIISLHANIRINALVLYMVGSTTVGQTKVYKIGIMRQALITYIQ
jgi:hypothetical protein